MMVLGLIRALMPRDAAFVQLLCRHSACVVEGAEAFRDMLGGGSLDAHYEAVCRAEERADDATREVLRAVHRSFVTPFDRSQILDLVTALDDTIDLMKEAGRRIRLYGVAFTPEMRGMAECAVRAAGALRDAMPLLDHIGRNLPALDAMQAVVRQAEGQADDLLAAGLRDLFAGPLSPGQKLTVEKVYDLIEAVVDRCEDVADVVAGIVVEQV